MPLRELLAFGTPAPPAPPRPMKDQSPKAWAKLLERAASIHICVSLDSNKWFRTCFNTSGGPRGLQKFWRGLCLLPSSVGASPNRGSTVHWLRFARPDTLSFGLVIPDAHFSLPFCLLDKTRKQMVHDCC